MSPDFQKAPAPKGAGAFLFKGTKGLTHLEPEYPEDSERHRSTRTVAHNRYGCRSDSPGLNTLFGDIAIPILLLGLRLWNDRKKSQPTPTKNAPKNPLPLRMKHETTGEAAPG